MSNLKVVSDDAEFRNLLSSAGKDLVVVDFFTTWCGPCKKMEGPIKSLAMKFPNVLFLKVDADRCFETAMKHDISGVPLFVFYRNNHILDQIQGAQPTLLDAKVTALESDYRQSKVVQQQQKQEEKDKGSTGGIPLPSGPSSSPLAEVGAVTDVMKYLDLPACKCINDLTPSNFESFISGKKLVSGKGSGKLLLVFVFKEKLVLNSFIIKAKLENGPKVLRFFSNHPKILDFNVAAQLAPSQEVTLCPDDLNGERPIEFRAGGFNYVTNLQVFITDVMATNWKNAGFHRIDVDSLTLYGAPVVYKPKEAVASKVDIKKNASKPELTPNPTEATAVPNTESTPTTPVASEKEPALEKKEVTEDKKSLGADADAFMFGFPMATACPLLSGEQSGSGPRCTKSFVVEEGSKATHRYPDPPSFIQPPTTSVPDTGISALQHEAQSMGMVQPINLSLPPSPTLALSTAGLRKNSSHVQNSAKEQPSRAKVLDQPVKVSGQDAPLETEVVAKKSKEKEAAVGAVKKKKKLVTGPNQEFVVQPSPMVDIDFSRLNPTRKKANKSKSSAGTDDLADGKTKNATIYSLASLADTTNLENEQFGKKKTGVTKGRSEKTISSQQVSRPSRRSISPGRALTENKSQAPSSSSKGKPGTSTNQGARTNYNRPAGASTLPRPKTKTNLNRSSTEGNAGRGSTSRSPYISTNISNLGTRRNNK